MSPVSPKIELVGVARVCLELGMSRATFYRRLNDPAFPRPRKEGQRLKVPLAAVLAYARGLERAR